MAIVVDTCSLVMMARNYLPLDDDNSMVAFIKQSFAKGKLLLLDIILDEARRTSKGVVLERMPFLDDKKNVVKTTDLLPPAPRKFDDMVDNNFCVRLLKNELTEEEYIQQKSEFMKSGDAKIVVYSWSMNYGQADMFANDIVMTEETRNQNDGKLFMKLPRLCDFLKVKVITAVDYLYQNGFKIAR